MLGVTRRDRKRNVDIMKTLDISLDKHIIEILRIRRLTYFGHVSHMPAERFPHIALFGRTKGSRTRGRRRKKWLDNVRENCAATNLTLVEATRVAEDRRF